MNEKEYQQARRLLLLEIEEKQKDLDALDRVYNRKIMSGFMPTTPVNDPPGPHESNGAGSEDYNEDDNDDDNDATQSLGKGDLLRAIQSWCTQNPMNFTAPHVAEQLRNAGIGAKDGSVKSALARLVDQGFLKLVTQGAGRRPSVYRKAL